jgi:hypothetical protein
MTWPKRSLEYPKRDDPQRETKLELRNRHIRRQKMLTFRSVPVKRRIWWVTLTRTSAAFENFSPRELPKGLTFDPQAFWCLSRRKAKRLVDADRQAGGSGALYPAEYRLCAVCSRPLLGPEAHAYRMKQMKPERTWQFEAGPMCSASCEPHGRGPSGQPARYRPRTAAPGALPNTRQPAAEKVDSSCKNRPG